jgi:hypothetical protein
MENNHSVESKHRSKDARPKSIPTRPLFRRERDLSYSPYIKTDDSAISKEDA